MNSYPFEKKTLPFGVLDLCKRSDTQTTGQAIGEIIQLARLADDMGYSRYWLAEHHVPYVASPAPELILSLLSQQTQRIRIGTGGTILGYYSPYKIAEVASTLQTLSGGRFDLGICRGPGVVDKAIASELVSGNLWELEDSVFSSKIGKTAALIRGITDAGGIKIHNAADDSPQLWMLGSGDNSAILANKFDMSLAIALFITKDEERAYSTNKLFYSGIGDRNKLQKKSTMAVSVVAADTEEKANLRHEKLVSCGTMPSNIVGSYKQVTEKLNNLLSKFEMDELLIVLLSRDHQERIDTYGCIAENFSVYA